MIMSSDEIVHHCVLALLQMVFWPYYKWRFGLTTNGIGRVSPKPETAFIQD